MIVLDRSSPVSWPGVTSGFYRVGLQEQPENKKPTWARSCQTRDYHTKRDRTSHVRSETDSLTIPGFLGPASVELPQLLGRFHPRWEALGMEAKRGSRRSSPAITTATW